MRLAAGLLVTLIAIISYVDVLRALRRVLEED
jgi:hypothetical protein